MPEIELAVAEQGLPLCAPDLHGPLRQRFWPVEHELRRSERAIGGGCTAAMYCLFFNIVPEAAVYLGDRDIAAIAASTVFNTQPNALCVSSA